MVGRSLQVKMNKEKSKNSSSIWGILILLLLSPLLIVLIPVILIIYLLLTILLHVLAWLMWNTKGIELLYIYSNSPHWQEYIEQNILPRLPKNSIVMNWSERKKWKFSLARMIFRHFGGYRDCNPIAFVIRPLGWIKIFRFLKPFKDFKHGKPEKLNKIEADFFAYLSKKGKSEQTAAGWRRIAAPVPETVHCQKYLHFSLQYVNVHVNFSLW